jgi:hypothetical protein
LHAGAQENADGFPDQGGILGELDEGHKFDELENGFDE